jgi:hypothetical protein
MLWRSGVVLAVAAIAGCSKGPAPQANQPPGSSRSTGKTAATEVAALPSIFSTAAAPSGSPFWPRFHGPKGDNLSTDTGLLKKWPEG